MSHELRTPLNTVIGFAKLLGEQQKRRHQDGQVADLIRDAATHLLAVINDILDISKLQSGKYTVDSKEVDLDEVLQLSLAALKPAAIARGILMESKLNAALPSVRGDAGKLRQVFGTPDQRIPSSSRLPAAASPSPPKPWRTAVSACAFATPALA
mgnify:CR=1 FL=1